MQRFRACWVTQFGGGLGGDVGDPDEARDVVDEEEHMEPPEPHGFDAVKVGGHKVGLSPERRGTQPRMAPTARARAKIDALTLEERPDARRGRS